MRDKFTSTGPIPVSELRLDPDNYRIGPLETQQDCINMMFKDKDLRKKVLALARHISQYGLTPEHIVVIQDNGHWLVRDGNRRITAIKLLNNPNEAPDNYVSKFKELRDICDQNGGIPSAIDCLTADEEYVRQYVQLKHLGEQGGVGQVNWGAREKDNMEQDIGAKRSNALAKEVCGYLEAKGIKEAAKAPITNIQRLLQDKDVQQRVGIGWDGTKFTLKGAEELVFPILKEIILDFTTRKKTVGAIYYQDDRATYLNGLFGEHGFTTPPTLEAPTLPQKPGSKPSTTDGAPPTTNGDTPTTHPVPSTHSYDRKRVVRRGMGLPVPKTETKVRNILAELSTQGLDVRQNPIAAGVLVRLLTEFSVDYYLRKRGIPFHSNDKLRQRIEKAGDNMNKQGDIDKKKLQLLKKMNNTENLLSSHTLNAWVHDPGYTPKATDICIFWDNLYFFLVKCWK